MVSCEADEAEKNLPMYKQSVGEEGTCLVFFLERVPFRVTHMAGSWSGLGKGDRGFS